MTHSTDNLGSVQTDRATFCAYLRSSREASQKSLEEISRITRIPERSLERLESGRFEELPADVFVRGFLRSYAECVGLEPEETVRRYAACGLEPAPVAAPEAASLVAPGPPVRKKRGRKARAQTASPHAAAATPIDRDVAHVTPVPRVLAKPVVEEPVVEPVAEPVIEAVAPPVVEEISAPVVAAVPVAADESAPEAAPAGDEPKGDKLVEAEAEQAAVEDADAPAVVTQPSKPRARRMRNGKKRKKRRKRQAKKAQARVTHETDAVDMETVAEVADAPVEAQGESEEIAIPVETAETAATMETAAAPVVEEPVVAEPVVAEPVVAEPAVVEPVVAEPASPALDAVDPERAIVDSPAADSDENTEIAIEAAPVEETSPSRLVRAPAPVIVIDDDDPEAAVQVLADRRRPATDDTRRGFLPEILRDPEDATSRRGALTLAVIILVIVATLTMSYLLRQPSSSTGDGVTQLDEQSTRLLG